MGYLSDNGDNLQRLNIVPTHIIVLGYIIVFAYFAGKTNLQFDQRKVSAFTFIFSIYLVLKLVSRNSVYCCTTTQINTQHLPLTLVADTIKAVHCILCYIAKQIYNAKKVVNDWSYTSNRDTAGFILFYFGLIVAITELVILIPIILLKI